MNRSSLLPRRQPFFYLTMVLLAGILAQRFFTPAPWLMLLLLTSSGLISVVGILRKAALVVTLALLTGFFAIGALLAHTEGRVPPDSRLSRLFAAGTISAVEPVELTGTLLAPPEPAPDACYLDVEAEEIRTPAASLPASGRARLIVAFADAQSLADFRQLGLDYGSRLRLLVRLERARAYRNPGAIDFNDFLERQGYDLKGSIKSPLLIESLGRVPVNRFLDGLYGFRLRLLEAIDGRFRQPVAGTLKAMLFGNRYFLDAEISERLRQSATFHTLVISGMHVSLLAFALLSFPLPRLRRAPDSRLGFSLSLMPGSGGNRGNPPKPLRLFLALLTLWAYTLMVGLAPPVTRATVMLSLGLLAPMLFRQAASLNTVALAAFLMLALKPALVADPGFQLSFIAVAAIVVIALPLARKLQSIGEWQPTPATPRPPSCAPWLKAFAEILYWDERAFNREMRHAPITYRLDKSPVARRLNGLRLQWLLRNLMLLLLTSTAIQFLTLPLMLAYFNRVAPVGILLNLFAGLLTGIIMLAAVGALLLGSWQATLAAPLIWLVNAAHGLLVHSVNPFLEVSGMSFRAAHYEGWQTIIYALYFVPIAGVVFLIDRWQPIRVRSQESGIGSQESEVRSQNEVAGGSPTTVGIEPLERARTAGLRWKAVFSMGVLVVFILSMVAMIKPPVRLPRGRLTIYFLDVGQGDAALVVFPGGSTMLIDGGGELNFSSSMKQRAAVEPDSGPPASGEESEAVWREQGFSVGESVVSRFLWSQGLTQVDYLLATHADADHMDGLAAVAKNFMVSQAIVGRVVMNNAEFNDFAGAISRQQTPLARLNAGERFELEGVTIEALWPLPARAPALKSANNDSIVLRLRHGANAILLTGDIEREGEASLLQSGINLQAQVLKIPHHGSKTSSTEAFIDAVKPRLAIVSAGERSRFGHPHATVVERYRSRGIELLQTGRDGMITVQSDGRRLAVSPGESLFGEADHQ
jgi:competence protein ComEC